MGYKLNQVMYCWTPRWAKDASPLNDGTHVGIVQWPDSSRASRAYVMALGACMTEFRKAEPERRLLIAMLDFNHMVVRDGICPKAAHKAFLQIDEYRDAMSRDMPFVGGFKFEW